MDILVVDDDEIDFLHIKRTLKKAGGDHYVAHVKTVDDAIKEIGDLLFDVILLDYNLPQRDGIELLLELKGNPVLNKTAVVVISTSEEESVALECLKAGAQDFLVKSEISPFRLHRAIINVQARFKLEQELYSSYQKVKNLAEKDSLTGLPNRYLFDETLKLSIQKHQRTEHYLVLMLLDLDHFKYVNDNYGHHIGDQLLVAFVHRINEKLRSNEVLSRLGGDEFAISLSALNTPQQAAIVANRILKSLEEPFDLNGIIINTSMSIGLSVYLHDGDSAQELFKNADIAMYRTKATGRGGFTFYEESMQQEMLKQIDIENNLRNAIQNDELTQLYQPILNTQTHQMIGVEALLRWNFEGNFIPPDEFIPIAERSKLIIELGQWVIRQAIYQLSEFNKNNAAPITMAINISPVQLSDTSLIDFIKSCLKEFNVAANMIEIELTETALLINDDQNIVAIKALKSLGCKIALDDFGTGFSSLSHLKEYAIDTVKIDKSLIAEVTEKEKVLMLVKGLTYLIKSLGLNAVAEGIENEAQLAVCKKLNIEKSQGYYFNKPLESHVIMTLL